MMGQSKEFDCGDNFMTNEDMEHYPLVLPGPAQLYERVVRRVSAAIETLKWKGLKTRMLEEFESTIWTQLKELGLETFHNGPMWGCRFEGKEPTEQEVDEIIQKCEIVIEKVLELFLVQKMDGNSPQEASKRGVLFENNKVPRGWLKEWVRAKAKKDKRCKEYSGIPTSVLSEWEEELREIGYPVTKNILGVLRGIAGRVHYSGERKVE